MEKEPTISCIIPAFNEERTVAGVVMAACSSKFFCQVICVSDGSKDQTPKILKSFGKKITLINFIRNYGKGAAMAAGVRKAKGEIIVFLDADLITLQKKHIKQLVNPLLKKKLDVVLGFYPRFTPWKKITGERAYFRQDLLPYCQALRKKRFGAEVFLNNVLSNKKTKFVYLKGCKKLLKPHKLGLSQEMISEYLKEALEISQEIIQQQNKSVKNKLKLQRKIIKKFLKKYLKRTKEIEELLNKSKTYKKLKKLLEI